MKVATSMNKSDLVELLKKPVFSGLWAYLTDPPPVKYNVVPKSATYFSRWCFLSRRLLPSRTRAWASLTWLEHSFLRARPLKTAYLHNASIYQPKYFLLLRFFWSEWNWSASLGNSYLGATVWVGTLFFHSSSSSSANPYLVIRDWSSNPSRRSFRNSFSTIMPHLGHSSYLTGRDSRHLGHCHALDGLLLWRFTRTPVMQSCCSYQSNSYAELSGNSKGISKGKKRGTCRWLRCRQAGHHGRRIKRYHHLGNRNGVLDLYSSYSVPNLLCNSFSSINLL